ncbi:MAG: hypothetical protein GY801_18940 [bacterium]|nr:hypothetical protein [bacterium]
MVLGLSIQESVDRDPRSGVKQRHHISKAALQKAVRNAIRKAGVRKHAFERYLHVMQKKENPLNWVTCGEISPAPPPYKKGGSVNDFGVRTLTTEHTEYTET